ncbi:MAG: hypothetical protein ACXWV9_11940, partial [Flavisolibacter sp.]
MTLLLAGHLHSKNKFTKFTAFIFAASMNTDELQKNGIDETAEINDDLYQRFNFTVDKGQEP